MGGRKGARGAPNGKSAHKPKLAGAAASAAAAAALHAPAGAASGANASPRTRELEALNVSTARLAKQCLQNPAKSKKLLAKERKLGGQAEVIAAFVADAFSSKVRLRRCWPPVSLQVRESAARGDAAPAGGVAGARASTRQSLWGREPPGGRLRAGLPRAGVPIPPRPTPTQLAT